MPGRLTGHTAFITAAAQGIGRATALAYAAEGATVTLTSKQRMLTPEQVADAMGVSRSTISRKIKAGEINAVKVGNRNRVPYEEFERFWDKTMGDMVELVRDDIEADLFGDAR